MSSEYVSSSRFVHRDLTFELEHSSLHHMEERTDGQTTTHTLKWTVPNYVTRLANKVSYVCHQIRIGMQYHRLRILKYDTRIQVNGISQKEKLIYLLVGVTPALSPPTKASFAFLAGRDCEILPVNGLKNVLRHLPYRDCFVEFLDTYPSDNLHLAILCRFTVPVSLPVDLLKHNRILQDLERLQQDTETSDVTFIVEDREFKAHKTILLARSSVFRAMFRYHQTTDKEVTLSAGHHCTKHQSDETSSEGETTSDNHCTYHQNYRCHYDVITGTEENISPNNQNVKQDSRQNPDAITVTEVKAPENHGNFHQDYHETITGTEATASSDNCTHYQDSRRLPINNTDDTASSENHTYHQESRGNHEAGAKETLSSDRHHQTSTKTSVSNHDCNHDSSCPKTTTCTDITLSNYPGTHLPGYENINTTGCPVSHQPSNENIDTVMPTVSNPVSHLSHRNIDTKRSPVLHYPQSRTVAIADTDADTFVAFLSYLYTSKLRSLSPGLAQDLLTLADKYDIQDLKEEVADFLLCNLSVDCVLRTLVLADRHREGELKDQAVTYVARNLKQVMKRQEWTNFRKQFDLIDDVLRRIAGL